MQKRSLLLLILLSLVGLVLVGGNSLGQRSLAECYAAAGAALPRPADVSRLQAASGACLTAQARRSAPYVVSLQCTVVRNEAECVQFLQRLTESCAAAFFDQGASCDAYPRLDDRFFR